MTTKQNTLKILTRPDYRIGFAGTYYTLWTVRTEPYYQKDPVTGKAYPAGTSTSCTYHQNLSKDKDKAIAKAKAMGAVKLDVLDELIGRRGSFVRFERAPEPPKPADTFHFGKYRGRTFAEVNDVEYVFWYHNTAHNTDNVKAACDYLLANGDGEYVLFKGQLMVREDVEAIKRRSRARTRARRLGFVEGVMERNITGPAFKVGDVKIFVGALELNRYEYNDHEYFLPVIDGKGKRVKGKTVRVEVTTRPTERDEQDGVDFVAQTIAIL